MSIEFCTKCDKVLSNGHNMSIQTEMSLYQFCAKCIKEGFDSLNRKKRKTPEEISLLSEFRGFLKRHKLLLES